MMESIQFLSSYNSQSSEADTEINRQDPEGQVLSGGTHRVQQEPRLGAIWEVSKRKSHQP